MKLVDAETMRAIDSDAIENKKIPSLTLMENAGRGIFEYLRDSVLADFEDPKIAVVCGRGNNGGDGFVIGRYLIESGFDTEFYLAGSDDRLSDDCRTNYGKLKEKNISVSQVADADLLPDFDGYDLVIDAIFGTGFSGAPRGVSADLIGRINDCNALIIAVDAPSGLDVSTGDVASAAVIADQTCTLALPKPGLFISPGREYAGAVAVVPIGIPRETLAAFSLHHNLITPEDIARRIPEVPSDAHKGTMGKIAIIGGSVGLTGALCLAGMAAARTGSGLVTVGCPQSLNPILETKLTEVMTFPLPEIRNRQALAVRARGDIRRLVDERDAAGIGPGIGRHHETVELVLRLIEDLDVPAVIDADALFALGKNNSVLQDDHAPFILTPHPGEFARLTGVKPARNPLDNFDLVAEWAETFGSILVLKASPTIIGTPEGDVWLNPTGNSGMATGGSGDVLTGIITALLGQGLSPLDAALSGVYLHGLAADLAIKDINPRSLIPGDIIDYLSPAITLVQGTLSW